MKNKIIQIFALPLFVFFLSFSSSAANLNIAFFASSSENGYNQATWEGVKKAASEAGNVNAEIFNGEFNATLQYGQIEDIIASGKFDGFVVVPNDTVGIAGAIEQAIDAGIKVATSLFPIGPDLTTLDRFFVISSLMLSGKSNNLKVIILKARLHHTSKNSI